MSNNDVCPKCGRRFPTKAALVEHLTSSLPCLGKAVTLFTSCGLRPADLNYFDSPPSSKPPGQVEKLPTSIQQP